MEHKIEIPLSKTKLALLLLGSIAFVAFGIMLILNPEQFIRGFLSSATTVRIVGIIAVAFFGLCMLFIVRKLFDNKVGLTIDKNGITDNTNATSVGLIEWGDITGIGKVQVASTKILLLQTDKPDKYIDRAKNGISRRAMKTNYKMYGSPLSIVSNSLKIRYNDLEKLILIELEKRNA